MQDTYYWGVFCESRSHRVQRIHSVMVRDLIGEEGGLRPLLCQPDNKRLRMQ